jgi:hypothetical protein
MLAVPKSRIAKRQAYQAIADSFFDLHIIPSRIEARADTRRQGPGAWRLVGLGEAQVFLPSKSRMNEIP